MQPELKRDSTETSIAVLVKNFEKGIRFTFNKYKAQLNLQLLTNFKQNVKRKDFTKK